MQRRTFLKIGDRLTIRCNYSEVACHLRVAGKMIPVEIINGGTSDRPVPMAQILNQDGSPFSFPVHCGEVGIYGSKENLYILE